MKDNQPHRMWLSRWLLYLLLLMIFFGSAGGVAAAEVMVVGDKRLKPVLELIDGVQEVLDVKVPVYSASDANAGKLIKITEREGAKIVIALGQEAINEALTLPSSVTVLYALVILPPDIHHRPNTAGLYMGTPIGEYFKLLNSYLPELKRISVIGTPEVIDILDHSDNGHLTTYLARNPFAFVNAVNGLERADALLLLPDISILSKTALEQSYLFSFRKKVPLLGISKKHVRQGALFALEFDPEQVGRRLGLMAQASLQGQGFEGKPAEPSQYFNLYINRETAEKMGITIPNEMLKIAKNVYP